MSTTFLVITVLVIIFSVIFWKNHIFVKCSKCNKWMIVKISSTGEDTSNPGIIHFYEEGNCKKCGKNYSRSYEKVALY